jgi:hypothetical protein
MTKKLPILVLTVLVGLCWGQSVFAQDENQEEIRRIQNEFAAKNWHKFDFAAKKVTKAQLDKLSTDGLVSELELLRGVVFGKRGRIFKERPVQDFLERQSWYKPNAKFSNSVLTKMERDNIDLIRQVEAEKHLTIQPGDYRWWQNKLITAESLGSYTAAEWRVMIAEIEAIHGKTFPDEEWLQKYFNERYWYKPNPNYSPAVLTETERKNIAFIIDARNQERNVAVSVGDMDKFQNSLLTEELLKGLSMNDLRLLRNEFLARRGYKFNTPGIRQYFDWRDWYKPLKDQRKVKLNETEKQNIKLIESVEAKLREKIATELISSDTLGELFVEDLRVLRNEIYARRGRVFKDAQLQKYFSAQSWYKPNPEFKDDMLTEIEYKNLAVIREAEQGAISKFSEFEG